MNENKSRNVIETDQFVFFWRGWPAQWRRANFTVDSVAYNCCEQFMMAEKARVFGDVACLKQIMAAIEPAQQKAIGRLVRDFDEAIWNSVCRGIVYTGNLSRFSQDSSLGQTLLATGSKTMVEASPVDRIWGIGLAADDPRARDVNQWQGTNWLGIALIQVRETLRGGTDIDAELNCQIRRRAQIGLANSDFVARP